MHLDRIGSKPSTLAPPLSSSYLLGGFQRCLPSSLATDVVRTQGDLANIKHGRTTMFACSPGHIRLRERTAAKAQPFLD
jgi:hypothetical protein